MRRNTLLEFPPMNMATMSGRVLTYLTYPWMKGSSLEGESPTKRMILS